MRYSIQILTDFDQYAYKFQRIFTCVVKRKFGP